MINTLQTKIPSGPRGLDILKLLVGYYRDPLATLANTTKKYGDVVLFQVGPYSVYQIAHPDHIKHVLQDNNRNYHMGSAFDQTRPVVGRGLSTNEGESWLLHRRLMQPLFGRGQVAAFLPMMANATSTMLDGWRSFAQDGRRLSLYPELLRLNHHILGKLLFNVDVTGADAAILEALSFVREYTNQRINALVTVPAHWPTPRNRQFQKAVSLLDDFAYGLIRKARAGQRDSNDMLSVMLNARDEKTGAGLSDEELHDELMTLFFAAYEDPANALSWALALLTHHPDVEKRLRAEIDSVLGGRTPTYEDLAALEYTGAVIDETLRLYPPTWSILRDVGDADVIDGYPIQAGSSILVNIQLAHRLPEYWEQPDVFDPDRFLSGNAANRPRYAYLPFGGGPRQCIAAALATMQMKLILAMLMQRYQFDWLTAYPPQADATHSLRPPRDIAVRLKSAQVSTT
jgi:cytochrome P450